MMRIAVCGVGSSWTLRASREASNGARKRPAVYNSTAVDSGSGVRPRPVVYGVVRFSANAAVNPHEMESYLGCTFEGSGMRVDPVRRQLTLRCRAKGEPDRYVIALRSCDFGPVDCTGQWYSNGVTVISFSECGPRQEALLLLQPYNWVRTSRLVLLLERPSSRAELRKGVLREVPL